jgi:DNA-binding GntR family transcriptional regulator
MIDGVTIKTRADLARHLGVSRAAVTKALGAVRSGDQVLLRPLDTT